LYEMLTGRLPWTRSETLTRLGGGVGETPTFAPTGADLAVDRLVADLLAFSAAGRPACGEEAVMRLATGEAGAAKTTCSACGASRPEDLPRCLSCGEAVTGFGHDTAENWRLVLRSLADDAADV